jgi:hypothetical protein
VSSFNLHKVDQLTLEKIKLVPCRSIFSRYCKMNKLTHKLSIYIHISNHYKEYNHTNTIALKLENPKTTRYPIFVSAPSSLYFLGHNT